MPKVELMGEILPNLEFLVVVDPKKISFGFMEKACLEGMKSDNIKEISSPLVNMFIDIC